MDERSKKRRVGSSDDEVNQKHLNWTSIQGHSLTGGGRAEELYVADRGFPFQESELPHHHLVQGDTQEVFSKWKTSVPPATLVGGAWNRPLFCGGWHHTTDQDERVYNVQTHNLFVDLRIPKTRERVLPASVQSLKDLTPRQLRLYARQHVFAGYSVPSSESGRPLCTRHHCIDWNFVGQGRLRPNKWWIDMKEDQQEWKESSYATDERGQYYYFERWRRWPNGGGGDADGPRLALRKSGAHSRDGILVVVGDHFNYVLARELSGEEKDYGQSSLVSLVDAAVEAGDFITAQAYLSIEAGHGTISSGWKLDCAIPPWKEGTLLWDPSRIQLEGDELVSCKVVWNEETWEILDCNFENAELLKKFLSTPS